MKEKYIKKKLSNLLPISIIIFILTNIIYAGQGEKQGLDRPDLLEFKPQKAIVVYVEDGNTIHLKFNNHFELRAYLMSMDAPYQRGIKHICGVQESRDFLRSLIAQGDEVLVEWDSNVKISKKSKKILVYLSKDNLDINADMIRNGWAWVPKKYDADRKDQYLQLETAAKDNQLGFWSLCDQNK